MAILGVGSTEFWMWPLEQNKQLSAFILKYLSADLLHMIF